MPDLFKVFTTANGQATKKTTYLFYSYVLGLKNEIKKRSFQDHQNYLSDLVALILSAKNYSMMLMCYLKIIGLNVINVPRSFFVRQIFFVLKMPFPS